MQRSDVRSVLVPTHLREIFVDIEIGKVGASMQRSLVRGVLVPTHLTRSAASYPQNDDKYYRLTYF
jgi:hypothetical protein